MRHFIMMISLLSGSVYGISANASVPNSTDLNTYASENIYAFEVEEEEGWMVDDRDAQIDDEPQVYERASYNQYAYSEGKKYKKHGKKKGGGGFASSRPATGRTVFIFNPNILTWAVYDSGGRLIRTGHGSGGRGYCPDIRRSCKTPSGTFSIVGKAGPGFRSSRYPLPGGGAPMPYAMFFSKYYAIHGSNDVPGYNASHGCVRVYTSDARWLSQNIIRYGTTVIIHGY